MLLCIVSKISVNNNQCQNGKLGGYAHDFESGSVTGVKRESELVVAVGG